MIKVRVSLSALWTQTKLPPSVYKQEQDEEDEVTNRASENPKGTFGDNAELNRMKMLLLYFSFLPILSFM